MKENPIDPDKVSEDPKRDMHHIGSAPALPVNKTQVKSRALMAMEHQTDQQLEQIKEQIELLARQAKNIQERRELSFEIYNADINFEPIINQVYYLYRRANGQNVLSMIGPAQWGSKAMPFDEYLCTCKLLADHTWDILDKA